MYLEFMDQQHKDNFNRLMTEAKVSSGDMDRVAMFYVIAGNTDLMNKVRALYDFKNKEIYLDWAERADFSGGARRLVALAFNLFNGYETNPYNTFGILDCENRELAHRAIRVRFPY